MRPSRAGLRGVRHGDRPGAGGGEPQGPQGAEGVPPRAAALAVHSRPDALQQPLPPGLWPAVRLHPGVCHLRRLLWQEEQRGLGTLHRQLRLPGRRAHHRGRCLRGSRRHRQGPHGAEVEVPPHLLHARGSGAVHPPFRGEQVCRLLDKALCHLRSVRLPGRRCLARARLQRHLRCAAALVVQRRLRRKGPLPQPQPALRRRVPLAHRCG
mmetsp:Transcript_133286/g.414439  ORF Transcript_133286/g.414439 Transcript_133286/m.414439 type:complete len:210 (-) Transcript_133286:1242-1871(-)